MRKSRHVQAVQAALTTLVSDTDLSDRQRLRDLELIETEICGLIADIQARLPEPSSRQGDPPRI
jgi:hypothetical protein